jgi:hypothetical protein
MLTASKVYISFSKNQIKIKFNLVGFIMILVN